MTDTSARARVIEVHGHRYGLPALVVRSPGRINLIGEHTDAALGYVLPAAIDRAIWLTFRARGDRLCRVTAVNLDESVDLDLDALPLVSQGWVAYVCGVYKELADAGVRVGGVDCVFGGDLPVGGGLSSSAALTCGFAFGLSACFEAGDDRLALAHLAQRVEHRHVGVRCGLMDQVASLMGRAGQVMYLDCRDLSRAFLPIHDDLAVVLCDSHVRRSLAADGAYNERRAHCEAGLAVLRARHPHVTSLRDVTPPMLADARAAMRPVEYRRCRYVIEENARVLDVCAGLAAGDDRRVGFAMNASHHGLQHDFEVSCPALDALAAAAREVPGVVGSRMMGAGFGGYTITLARRTALPALRARLAAVSDGLLGKALEMHVCQLSDGTSVDEVRA